MDTPERNQIATPISKFQDSPVFNYINSLSPITAVKPSHIAQTFNSLSFASLPSEFTSPNGSSHQESRFLRRHHFLDPSKPELSSHNGNDSSTTVGILDAAHLSDGSADLHQRFDPGSSVREGIVEQPNEHSELAIELRQTLKYDCGSPDISRTSCHDSKTDPEPSMDATPASLIQFVKEVPENISFESEVQLQGICQFEKNKEGPVYDWENLISDASDLLIFYSPTNTEASKRQDQKSVDPGTSLLTSLVSQLPCNDTTDLQKTQHVGPLGCCEQHEMEDPVTQPGEVEEPKETDQTPNIISCTSLNKQVASSPSEKMDDKAENCCPFDCKPDFRKQCGMRRRCLVFEMAGAHKKNLDDNCNSSSSISSQSEGKIASDDKKLVPTKLGSDTSLCMLPGIGLHLNAVATTSKGYRVAKHETLASGRQLISMPSSIASFNSLTSGQKSLNKSLVLNDLERDEAPDENGDLIMQDASQAYARGVNEEFNQSSPKKKRYTPLTNFTWRRLEHPGESEACKRCNCKKSKCLKLYCECFAAGVYCVEPCSCQECFNNPVHEDTVLATRKQIESRNPLAFAPKVIRSSNSIPEIGDESNKTPASARHKRGCNCKKSSCLKKYCECYQDAPLTADVKGVRMHLVGRMGFPCSCSFKSAPRLHDPDSAIKGSFLFTLPLVQVPFSSRGKPPQASRLVGSSPGLHTCQRLGKSDFLQSQPNFEQHFQNILEDETPDILRGNYSPISGIKTASPNLKRVSPPHTEFRLSPGRRSGRKLILQSVPSFPSLTPHHETRNF
ncbi:hypothetical protein HHK36_026761 [Tetracentron sinense]|uniref:CRC domain-containing protein n=1 Tax=Tetracentron sinense TaxID=13715 RepID=A0A834YK88_TETSI|nr:hypothetical protein HHK36_026761 [Tetracentron sinense]